MANLTTPPVAIFNQIRANLQDRYKSGFPVIKELIQNAEDAKATAIHFIGSEGNSRAQNPLLRVPGLLVANDGKFDQKDSEGILKFAASEKVDDEGAIGKFGFGQKSVFHVCDAFVAHSFGDRFQFAEVVNPCLGVIENTLATTWDTVGDEDLAWLRREAGRIQAGFLIWIPLRNDSILPAPKLSFTTLKPDLEDLVAEIAEHSADLHLVMAGLRHLNQLSVLLRGEEQLYIERDAKATKLLGPHALSGPFEQGFRGQLASQNGARQTYFGREALARNAELEQLIESAEWPTVPTITEHGSEVLPEKASIHGAVVIAVGDSPTEDDTTKTTLEWGVFLPVAEALSFNSVAPSVKVMLHGYFFVDSGRRYIEGIDEDASPNNVRARWNEVIRDAVVLPLLPEVLLDAYKSRSLTHHGLREVARAIGTSHFGKRHSGAITARHSLVQVLSKRGNNEIVDWKLVSSEVRQVPVCAPAENGIAGASRILPRLLDWAEENGIALVCDSDAALTPEAPTWNPEELSAQLGGLSADVFSDAAKANALGDFLEASVPIDSLDLRVAISSPVIGALRAALIELRPLAAAKHVRRILRFLPDRSVVGLRSSAATRTALRALAEADQAPLCVNNELLGSNAQFEELSLANGTLLLAKLEPLLSDAQHADAASAAVADIVKLLTRHLRAADRDSDIHGLKIVRVSDGSGAVQLVSLEVLAVAAEERRLFAGDPQVQRYVGALRKALPAVDAYFLHSTVEPIIEAIGGRNALTQPTPEAFTELAARAEVFGPPEARAHLALSIFSYSQSAQPGLRALVAGSRRALHPGTRLISMPAPGEHLDRIVMALLDPSGGELLVPSAIASELNSRQKKFLWINEWDGPTLGRFLADNADRIPEGVKDDEVLSALLANNIPDTELRSLPIFRDSAGVYRRADEVWRESCDWAVPSSLVGVAPILDEEFCANHSDRLRRLIHQWAPDAQIRSALNQPSPSRFAKEILAALAEAEPGGKTLETLRNTEWLVDKDDRAWMPGDVIDLPEELQAAARQALPLSGDPEYLFSADISTHVREQAGFHRLRELRVLPSAEDAESRLFASIQQAGLESYLGRPTPELALSLKTLADEGRVLNVDSWRLLAAILRGTKRRPIEVLQNFTEFSTGSTESTSVWLQSLAELSEAGSSDSWTAYKAAFNAVWAWPGRDRLQIMRRVSARNKDGEWRPASEIALLGTGTVHAHMLHDDLQHVVVLALPSPTQSEPTSGPRADQPEPTEVADSQMSLSVDGIRSLLKYSAPHVPPELLILLVGLLDQTDHVKDVVRNELSVHSAHVQQIWNELLREVRAECWRPAGIEADQPFPPSNTKVFVFLSTELQGTIELDNLCGEMRVFPVGDLEPFDVLGQTVLSSTGCQEDSADEAHQIGITLAAPPNSTVSVGQVRSLFSRVLELTIGRFYQVAACAAGLESLVERYAQSGQTSVESVKDELIDWIPGIIAALKSGPETELRQAYNEYARKMHEIPPGLAGNKENRRRGFKAQLWEMVSEPETSAELLHAVRDRIEDYGYDPKRVLFELFQNADDASVQHPPPVVSKFRLEVDEGKIRAVHWGRLINRLGDDAHRGEREGWHRDLFNMLLMNLSDKQEETTGRFGLGFKSVHLISREVGIASGSVACIVRGGMLPSKWATGSELSFAEAQGARRATIVELSISRIKSAQAVRAIEAFKAAGRWLTVTSRAIHTLEIHDVNSEISVQTWASHREASASDLIEVVTIDGPQSGSALALKLGAGVTMFLPVSEDGPAPAASDVPRLWLLAPLEESLATGWLMNGLNFRVDPGRGRLGGTDEERTQLFKDLGEQLGGALVALFDLVQGDLLNLPDWSNGLGTSSDSRRESFLLKLFEFFKLDLQDPLASHLHSSDRGLGELLSAREALPSGLPAPFTSFLKASKVRYRLTGAIDEQSILAALGGWKSLERVGQASVSNEVSQTLTKLGFPTPTAFLLKDLISEEVGADRRISPAIATRLGHLLTPERVAKLGHLERFDLRGLLGGCEFLMTNGVWSRARLVPRNATDATGEEGRLHTFAPDSVVAADDYVGPALALYRLAAEESGSQRTPKEYARWAAQLADIRMQRGLLTYILEGAHGRELARELVHNRPVWLPQHSSSLRDSELLSGLDTDQIATLLSQLYPVENRRLWKEVSDEATGSLEVPDQRAVDPSGILEEIHSWWSSKTSNERELYDKNSYPSSFRPNMLKDREAREHWFTFFALGIFRTIGRTTPQAHRSFIESAQGRGWWREMAEANLPADAQPWLDRLEDFARADSWRIDYPQWRRGLVDLYALARWLPDYIDAFVSLPLLVRSAGNVSLADVWRLSASQYWERRGLEGAPLAQSLGLGANWMIREALRHSLWEDDARLMYPYAWAPTQRVRELLTCRLGVDLGLTGNMDESVQIYRLVERHLGDRATFDGDFDLPLQTYAEDHS